jgi:hypothetical protein
MDVSSHSPDIVMMSVVVDENSSTHINTQQPMQRDGWG